MAELAAKILVWGIDFFMKKNLRDTQAKKDYITFNKIMARKGLQTVQMRLRSEDQKKRIAEMWDAESKGE